MRTISIRKSLCAVMMAGAACLYATAAGTAPLINGEHYEENIRRSNCTNNSATVCGLPMASVPSGKKLLVTSVSCSVSYTGVPTFRAFHLAQRIGNITDSGGPPFTYFVPTLVPFTGNPALKIYVVNMQTNQLFTAGQTPLIFQSIGGGATFEFFNCTIFGTLMPAVT